MVEILKGIPIPPRAGFSGESKYPWTEMSIGDAFVVPYTDSKNKQVVLVGLHKSAKNKNVKITVRTTKQVGVAGEVTVWRVA